MKLRTMILAALLTAPVMVSVTARAADIVVLTSGGTGAAMRALGTAWTAKTGNKVTYVSGTVGKVKGNTASTDPGDLVILPNDDLRDVSASLKPGPVVPIGRVDYAIAVKAGTPHADISTLPKFIAVLKASTTGVAFTDPALGSLAGANIAAVFARPDFAGVKPLPMRGSAGSAVTRGEIQYGAGPVSEIVSVPGAEVMGIFPAELGLHLDYSAALLARSSAPDDAAAFLRFIASPDAAAVWKAAGIDVVTSR